VGHFESVHQPITTRPANRAAARQRTLRELRELIAALDRRVPHVERVGELSIAKAAAALKTDALKRIEELERELEAQDVVDR
jgi:hypothetical protein